MQSRWRRRVFLRKHIAESQFLFIKGHWIKGWAVCGAYRHAICRFWRFNTRTASLLVFWGKNPSFIDRMQSADAAFWHPDTESQSNRTHVQTITQNLRPKKIFTYYKHTRATDSPDICERGNDKAVMLLYGDEKYSIWPLMFLLLLKQYGQMVTRWFKWKLCRFSVTNANKYLGTAHTCWVSTQ